jgi:hypothetical protein
VGDDAGRTRTQDEGNHRAESFPRVDGHLTEGLLKGQNKNSKNSGGSAQQNAGAEPGLSCGATSSRQLIQRA